MLSLRNISRYGLIVIISVIFVSSASPILARERPQDNYPYSLVTSLIRDRLTAYESHPAVPPDNVKIFSLNTLEYFYKARDYRPAWYGKKGFSDAESMIRAIQESADDGLIPANYHLRSTEDLLDKAYIIGEKGNFVDPEILADLDILLTDSFFTLARHLSAGCVNPLTLKPEWSFSTDPDLSAVLTDTLESHTVTEGLRKLAPSRPGYAELRKALGRYREMEKEDNQLPLAGGRLLRKGMRSPRVPELRELLMFLGDLGGESRGTGDLFDANVEKAVISFQERHGLKADGIVGPATLAELDVPVSERIEQLTVNLERMRWSENNRSDLYLIVNVANFELDVVRKGVVVLSMKVVVGKPYLTTPVFSGRLTYLVLNPVWNVPPSIAGKDILPKVKKDPGYLKEENITILRGWGAKEEVVDPETIDWRSVTAGNLNFRFRQEPGPLNSLGRIKFMFPNRFNVYLHDTPAKNLFSENVRTFSHGCIRIEKPVELAEYLLKFDPLWTKEDIEEAINSGETIEVRLPYPVNVYVVYVTAWIAKGGIVEFRKDIYGRDAALYSALTTNPLAK